MFQSWYNAESLFTSKLIGRLQLLPSLPRVSKVKVKSEEKRASLLRCFQLPRQTLPKAAMQITKVLTRDSHSHGSAPRQALTSHIETPMGTPTQPSRKCYQMWVAVTADL